MRKIIAAILFCLPLLVSAQIYTIDLTTLTTNTAINWGYMTISNSASMTTNQPFRTVKSNNVIVGDPLFNAFTKVNSNFQYLAAHTGTNAQGLTNVSVTTLNGLTNYAHISGSTLILRIGNTNSGTGGSESSSNAIPLLNGTGTNTVLITSPSIGVSNINVVNNTWLNSSNIHIYQSIVPPIAGYTTIPIMTSSNTPIGSVTTTNGGGNSGTGTAYYAFTASPVNYWGSSFLINPSTVSYVQYNFPIPVTCTSGSGYIQTFSSGGTLKVQASTNGTVFFDMYVNTYGVGAFYFTNSMLATNIVAVRYLVNTASVGSLTLSNLNTFYFTPAIGSVAGSTNQVINSPTGIALNTTNTEGYDFNFNGTVNIKSNLNTSSLTGSSASLGQISAGSISASDIASSGAMDASIYTLNGEPLNFSVITNQSFPSVLYCTNPPGLFGPTNSATNFFGTYVKNNVNGTWTNTANTSTMVPPHIYTNVLDQSAYGAPNAVYVFTNFVYSFVTNFTRNFRTDISTNIDWVQHPPTVTNLWFKGNSVYGNWNQTFDARYMASSTIATNYFPYVGVFTFSNTPASQTGSVIYITTNLTAATSATVNFPVAMPNTNYGVVFCAGFTAVATPLVTQKTTTSVTTSMGLFTGTLELGIIRN